MRRADLTTAGLLCCWAVPALITAGPARAAEAARPVVVGKQLTATLSASRSTVAPGQRIALTLDIDLLPEMHVYAPGVEGYIPIEWKIQDPDAFHPGAAVFPHPEKLYLRAIDETVPAYRGHFRLVRDITIPEESELKSAVDGPGHFTVDGSLRYQACDNRVCYIPQTLRLQWTFAYGSPGKSRP